MKEKKYTPLSTEHDQTHAYFPEEFPEGPYGSSIQLPFNKKDTKKDMRPVSRFGYEAKGLHEGIPRQFPGAHPINDDPETSRQGPYGPGIGSSESDD